MATIFVLKMPLFVSLNKVINVSKKIQYDLERNPISPINETRINMIRKLFFILSVIALAITQDASADDLQAMPLPKQGNCPSGYSASGNYCNPSSNARFAVLKVGSCPSGYSSSGGYCLASGANSKLAVPKTGSCPSGYSTSGAYCLSSK
jgi:hypothetical protein